MNLHKWKHIFTVCPTTNVNNHTIEFRHLKANLKISRSISSSTYGEWMKEMKEAPPNVWLPYWVYLHRHHTRNIPLRNKHPLSSYF